MTGNDIIALARLQFGEATALTLSDSDFQEWVNTALVELYNDLPISELRQLQSISTVSLTNGNGTFTTSWDRILAVLIDGVEIPQVPWTAIQWMDTFGYGRPEQAVWAQSGSNLAVRTPGTLPSSVSVRHMEPLQVSNFASPLTISDRWLAALAHLVTSYAYGQEEDHESAAMWRARYLSAVGKEAAAQ